MCIRDSASTAPQGARLIRLADKIAKLRDLVEFPPADWPAYRRREYFDWTAQVVAALRGTHPRLEDLFDQVQALRPA
jgi:guanosine-3',5'-bis(diphosphate) 3'-pyrophosphohydrolase